MKGGRLGNRLGVRSMLCLVSAGTLIVYFVVNMLLSGLFMDQYYVLKVKKQLVQAYGVVLQHPVGDLETMAELEKNNLRIVLFDPQTRNLIYNSRMPERLMDPMLDMMMANIQANLNQTEEDWYITTNGAQMVTTAGVRINIGNTITLGGRVGSLLVEISADIEPIENAADIAVQFSLATGVVFLIIAILLYNRLAGQIIRPLEEMNGLAEQIAKRDFSHRCDESANNELGHLAHSINVMSDTVQEYTAQLEEANRQLRADIQEKERNEAARRSLVDNISHDLKTPIALISGYAEGLGSGMAKTPEMVKEYCDVISDESDRMLEMITRMLTLSRLESGAVELQPEEFCLSDMLDDLLGMFEHKAEAEHITLLRHYGGEIYVQCDYVATEQSITNYIQNAMTHLTGERLVKVSLEDLPDRRVRVRVFNTAAPIPKEEQAKLWDSFYRGETSRRRRGGETGLGLAIVRSNMELMGLPYGMDNVEGGVVFWLDLPVS